MRLYPRCLNLHSPTDQTMAQAGLQPHHDGLSKTLSRISNYAHRQSDSPLDLDKSVSYVPKSVPPFPNILPSSDNFGDPYELGDAYDPLTKRSVWEIPLEDQRPYLRYLKSISGSFPHIRVSNFCYSFYVSGSD